MTKGLSTRKLIIQYTVLFLLVSLGVFAAFIVLGKSFMHIGDNFKQGYFWLAELRNNLRSFFAGDGYPAWSWSRGLGMDLVYHLDFFDLIPMLFPENLLELGYSVEMLAKLYCGGLAFLVYARDLDMPDFSALTGSICYVFSTWFLSVTMIQNSFICVVFMMPLLTMSIDWIYRKKSPLLFIIVTAYFLAHDAYVAYMAGIGAIIYMLLRYFAYEDTFEWKTYAKRVGSFIGYGLIATLISAYTVLPEVVTLMGASSESASDGVSQIFNAWQIVDYGKILITGGFTHGYTYIGLPIFALLVLPWAISKLSLRNTHVLMSVILVVMTLFPVVGILFNGLGYSTTRWYFLVVFFLNLAAMQAMDTVNYRSRRNLILLAVWLVILAVWTVGFEAIGLIWLYKRAKAFILLNLAAGAGIVFSLAVFKGKKLREVAVICIAALVLAGSWSLCIYLYRNSFISVGEVSERLETSTQRASAILEETDGSFYRTDQVDYLNFSHDSSLPANENLYWGSKTIYGYDSYITSDQFEFNRLLGNSNSFIMRVYTLGNDNRPGPDFLYGVKYFLGDDETNDKTGSDAYAGYGFGRIENADGVHVFENKYDVSLGYGYNAFISESEFLKLSRLEREQAIMQACVVTDETDSELTGIEELTAADIDTDVKNVPYEVIATRGLSYEDGTITADVAGAGMTLQIADVTDSQLMLSFDNLVLNDGDEMDVAAVVDGSERIEHMHMWKSNQSIADVCDFDVNLGYYDSLNGTVTITFEQAGTYTYDSLYLSAMGAGNYDKYALQREAQRLDVSEYDDRHVSGTVNMTEDGILYLSIPKYGNWEIYVDGEKVEKIEKANIAFVGAEVSEGEHSIELKYRNKAMLAGGMVSIGGIVIAITVLRRNRRKQK